VKIHHLIIVASGKLNVALSRIWNVLAYPDNLNK